MSTPPRFISRLKARACTSGVFSRPAAVFALSASLPTFFLERICPRAVRSIKADSPRTHSPWWARERYGDPRTPLEQPTVIKAARAKGTAVAPYEHNHHDPVLEFKEADEPSVAM